MFVYLWREFILLIHWLVLLQQMKEFDFFSPIYVCLHFSSCRRVVSCDSTGKVVTTLSWSLVK